MDVIGHRGAPARAPENTVASFRLALDAGVDAIESDVRQTADGALVLMHDDEVDRTTNGTGRISTMSLDDVRLLRAGSEPIPLLEDLLGLGCPAVLELKATLVDGTYRSAAPVARAVVPMIAGRTDIVVSSFDPAAIAEVRALSPSTRTALSVLPGAPLHWVIEPALGGGHAECHISKGSVTDGFVAEAHDGGLRVLVFTINDAATARALRDAGVDGIFTDDPEAILAALHEHA